MTTCKQCKIVTDFSHPDFPQYAELCGRHALAEKMAEAIRKTLECYATHPDAICAKCEWRMSEVRKEWESHGE